ncbi:hypothetical protein MTP99_006940 [Tenebrio molitor]|nr:hypothetical protein MTP99_006940 [Tenebrio molitor]
MGRDISQWSRVCLPCQKSKVKQRFEHVHVDIIGPLPPCQGHRYCLTMTDRFTRWLERHQHFQRHQHQPQLVPPQGQDERNDSLRDFVTTSESLGGEYCGDINPFECPAKKKLRTDEDTRTRQESRR